MRRSPLTLLFSSALLLAACGGGGGSTGGVVPSGGGTTPTPRATATPRVTPSPTPTPIPGAGQALSGPKTDPSGDWGPPGLASSADYPVNHSYDGTGQTIAVVIDSDVNRNDLFAFFSYFKIPTTARTITTKPVDMPAAIMGASQAQMEATLDVETVAGLAPGANVIIYEVPQLDDQKITDAYNQALSDKKAFVVNSSFGGCEGGVVAPEDPVFAAGAAGGVAYTGSAGDNGNACNTTPSVTIAGSWPATNPHVIGVGGTETDPGQGWTLTSHTLWNDKTCGSTGSQCAGGGGLSDVYHTPSYQLGLAGISSSSWRNTPDISYPAEDVGVYLNGKWTALNGTSWSAPEAAALFAEVYQYCGANGGPISGVTDPVTIPYYVYGKAPAAFLDVTAGKDQWAATTPFYTAAAGYDDASGFGVPYGWAFAQTACPGHAPASGLLARSSMSIMTANPDLAQHTGAYSIDVTPRVSDISDEGVRGAGEATPIQIVLQPGSDVAASESNVVSALQRNGFTITQRFANHLVVDAVAPSAAVEQFFRTRMHNVSQGMYGTRYLPTTQIEVPASIAPYAARVTLDNVVTRHHRVHIAS